MEQHRFLLKADWPGGRNDVGFIETSNLKTKISIPTEMDGPGIGTNPDEMLLGAAATCYIITLAAMMERRRIPVESLTQESEGIVEVDKGVITYKKIIHRPKVILERNCTADQIETVKQLTERAEKSCMISRAIQGNVEIGLEAIVELAN
ncbi:OsmC family protein [Heyndrickxia oleronia]|jgi:peroxiredoxin-like protein|uniref:OsmC family protein n=1 Tax=Heyndrickxia oleronia TaxID=38875 RepID=UPI000717000A|nr:OsmC family protein [Heyndrickxia oleronia]MCI1589555.1 OsmC family protein [Heyndrickxia oleronia]MCI1611391.1 OsmC family protein [Heyndrickxia oleronia]MCI1742833.1 OsmC family protein [Heyndrickxia oleronia]MCI1759912.1 OsmC family protein [Heyndrickxia oleronia]MCM3237964.1 OsmC family protein [Heyndrickxia oleronia]